MTEEESDAASRYSAAIMSAIREVSPDAIDSKAVLDALTVVISMTILTAAEDPWPEEFLPEMGAEFARGLTGTLVNMERARQNGMVLPFDSIGKMKH